VLATRRAEADEFYAGLPGTDRLSEDERRVQRQALGGLLWSKQFYEFHVEEWLDGDPAGPQPPEVRKKGRNADWRHLHNMDVISMLTSGSTRGMRRGPRLSLHPAGDGRS